MDWLNKFADGSYMPHGHCLAWQPDLLLMHVGSDILIALAYFSIPATLTILAYKRPDLNFNRFFILFSLFIFGCGATHVIETINIWNGYYYIEGVMKTMTAVVSVLTALAVWPMVPKLLNVPSFQALEQANAELKQEIARRESAERALSEMNRNLEEKVQRRTRDLEQSNKAMKEFVHVASHDLKAPLRGINNYAEFLQEDYGEQIPEEGRNYLRGIVDLSSRMARLLQSLLDYARIDSNQRKLETASMQGIFDRAAKRFHGDPSVSIELPKVRGKIRCYPIQLTSAIANIFDNAIKYNDSERKEIKVQAEQIAGTWHISISDNGIGIPENHHQDIFQFFKRLHGKNSYGGGSGAGLAIVKKVIEQIGGRITVVSQPGQGSCFELSLPAHIEQAVTETPPNEKMVPQT